jgi:hypothetical protein
LLREITGRASRACSVFLIWLALKDPSVLRPGEMRDTVDRIRAEVHAKNVALDMDRNKRLFVDTAKAMNLWNDPK